MRGKKKNRKNFVDTNSTEYEAKARRIGEGADRLSRAATELMSGTTPVVTEAPTLTTDGAGHAVLVTVTIPQRGDPEP
ncbi:hypothetical protein M0Q28_00385 [Patescibacteria group bacterium]|jgi:hypothetical protein|nr:hypothetical protein [Patescibacteria group bacterium]